MEQDICPDCGGAMDENHVKIPDGFRKRVDSMMVALDTLLLELLELGYEMKQTTPDTVLERLFAGACREHTVWRDGMMGLLDGFGTDQGEKDHKTRLMNMLKRGAEIQYSLYQEEKEFKPGGYL